MTRAMMAAVVVAALGFAGWQQALVSRTVLAGALPPSQQAPAPDREAAYRAVNIAYVNGCLLVSIVFGVLCESWIAFVAALLVTVCGGIYSDEIRLDRRIKSR